MKHLIPVDQFLSGKLLAFLTVLLCCASAQAQSPLGNLVVPVVFHIISQNPGTTTDQQITDAVADLNDAFAHTGPYAGGAGGVNTGIRFCLAKVDPNGGNSTGITRTVSVLSDFDSDLESDRLKNLVSWNTREYCNIWLVEGFENEYMTNFSCGIWSRRHDIGSGTFNSSGDYRDGIVTKEFGSELVSLMGLYLGLKYTFLQGNCLNSNCNTDGDGVCDTPPASAPGLSCNATQNSCSSDTLSGFNRDMPDLTSNFMSQSGPCTSTFTAGQAAKMRSNLNSFRNTLLSANKCSPPCGENISAGFTRNNWSPKPGDLIQFTSTSTGGTNYQWTVNGAVVGANSPNFSMVFTGAGKTGVSLKVYNANAGCYARYTDSVIVNCGVMARFSPNVRQIASKGSILLDSILFSNRSANATAYHWWMSNDKGMDPQMVSTTYDLNYKFDLPGNYSVWLIATNGTCSDTTEKFNFPVYDPTVDGAVSLSGVECYQETKLIANLSICNYGYAPIPAGTPVSFYDADPGSANAHKLPSSFLTPAAVVGKCCNSFSTIINVNSRGLNQLWAVFNDNGSSMPIHLPNTSFPETNYANNIGSASDFQFHVAAFPDSATLQPGDSLQLTYQASPGKVVSFLWSSEQDLTCTQCQSPYFIAEHKVYDITKKLVVSSAYACSDSSFTVLHIPPADDFRITVDSVDCAGADSLHAAFTICNNFKRGNIPPGLSVSFYDADPSDAAAHLLGPVFSTAEGNAAPCASYTGFFERSATGTVFAAVNNNGKDSAGFDRSLYQEVSLNNNKDTFSVTAFTVSISPDDTTITRSASIRLDSRISGGEARSFQWTPVQYLSCTDCASPVATPASRMAYQLTVQNAYACAATAVATIKTFSGGLVNIPNGFTPNNDGRNDVFYILGGKDVKLINDFSIFNRWGQKIFQVTHAEANDPQYGWNGLLNGKPAETGTYIYFATIAFTDGSTQLFKGTVTLIR